MPDEWIARLAALPLIDQPGAAFHYGHSTDLLGLLIARMEDAPLGDVLQRRIFDPLGMNAPALRFLLRSNRGELRRTALTMLVNYTSVRLVRVTRSYRSGPKGWRMSLAGKGFGQPWMII